MIEYQIMMLSHYHQGRRGRQAASANRYCLGQYTNINQSKREVRMRSSLLKVGAIFYLKTCRHFTAQVTPLLYAKNTTRSMTFGRWVAVHAL